MDDPNQKFTYLHRIGDHQDKGKRISAFHPFGELMNFISKDISIIRIDLLNANIIDRIILKMHLHPKDKRYSSNSSISL